MSTVVEVPGVGEVEFPDSMTPEQIAAQVQALGTQPQSTATQAVAAGAGEQLYGNLAGLLNLPTKAVNAGLHLALGPKREGDLSQMTRAEALFGQGPRFQIPELPLPTGRQLASAVEAPVQALMAGQSLPDAFDARMATRSATAQERPVASAVGGLLGDAATIASGRAPLVRGPGGLLDGAIRGGLDDLSAALGRAGPSSGARRTADRLITSDGFRALAQGAGRAVETGLEGAALSILQGGDPLEVAAYSAGGQVVSSLGASAFEGAANAIPGSSRIGKAASATAAALAAAGVVQLLKSATPGGDDDFIESVESGFNKVALALVVGGAVGVLGRRTNPEGVLRDFPVLADALTTVPRTGVIKLAQAAAEDPVVEQVVNNAASGVLSGRDAAAFDRVLATDDPVEGLRDWMERSPRIRSVLTAPDPRLARVPTTQVAEGVRPVDQRLEAMRADTRGAEIASSTEAARQLARVLPREQRGGLDAPRTFVGESLGTPTGGEALAQLGPGNRRQVLEVLLADLIGKSRATTGEGTALDGERLRTRWESLPQNVRQHFPTTTTKAVEALFSTTPDQGIGPMPQTLARALMTDGALAHVLRSNR